MKDAKTVVFLRLWKSPPMITMDPAGRGVNA